MLEDPGVWSFACYILPRIGKGDVWCRARNQTIPTCRHFEKGFVLGDGWAHGYFHWTQEHLPRLAIMYDHLQADTTIKIMAPMANFAISYIVDVLGFNRSRIIGHAGEYHFGTAFYSTPMLCGHALLQPLLLLRQVVFKRLGLYHTFSENPDDAISVPLVLFPLRNDTRQVCSSVAQLMLSKATIVRARQATYFVMCLHCTHCFT